jgi:hypothetical protein
MDIKIEDIRDDLLKKISEIAKDENISEDEALNEILKIGLKARMRNKIPEHLILNKDTYNPGHERRMSMSGIIETDEPFDTAKAIREVRNMEY